MRSIIKAENISFSYESGEPNPKLALDNVSIDIEEGSFTAILGHNGSGKSTLAKILCMILMPDSGKLNIMGKEMTGDDINESDIIEARRDIGMVFQNPDNQIVATIVEEDVAFGCENLGIESGEIRKRVDDALKDVNMSDYAKQIVTNLSGGQKQRIAIAGAIAMKRKCIIFDESTAMLDPLGRKDVMDIILKLNREEGITVVLITHYMNEATLADRIFVMDEGKMVRSGTPREIFSDPEFMWELGLDIPQTTEFLYKINSHGVKVAYDAYELGECAERVAEAVRGSNKKTAE